MMFTAKVINKMIVGEALQIPDAYLYSGPSHAADIRAQRTGFVCGKLVLLFVEQNFNLQFKQK